MNDTKTQSKENFAQSEWENAPLLSRNVIPQNTKNVVPQISNLTPLNPLNVEPQNILEQNRKKPSSENLNSPTTENTKSPNSNNVELHQTENAAPTNLEKSAGRRNSRKKSSEKKTYSQKRNVVPLKFFVSPDEKAGLEINAKKEGLSLSNYIRVNLGLPPNMRGRKKPNDLPSIDLGLDLEFELEEVLELLHK